MKNRWGSFRCVVRAGIVGAPGDDAADTATGRGVVARSSRDEVQMAVKNGLAGGYAVICAKVEAGNGGIRGLKVGSDGLRQAVSGSPFVRGEVAEGGDMPAGNDEGMTFTNRKSIAKGQARAILGQNSFGGQLAKNAGLIHGGRVGKSSPAGKWETQDAKKTAGVQLPTIDQKCARRAMNVVIECSVERAEG